MFHVKQSEHSKQKAPLECSRGAFFVVTINKSVGYKPEGGQSIH
jgi:hypothetical protein